MRSRDNLLEKMAGNEGTSASSSPTAAKMMMLPQGQTWTQSAPGQEHLVTSGESSKSDDDRCPIG